jgi:hypothetical protein
MTGDTTGGSAPGPLSGAVPLNPSRKCLTAFSGGIFLFNTSNHRTAAKKERRKTVKAVSGELFVWLFMHYIGGLATMRFATLISRSPLSMLRRCR